MKRIELPPGVDFDAGDLPVGAILRRRYQGKIHEVTVIDPPTAYDERSTPAARRRGWWRYEYRGRRYKSLSAIAYKLTGDRFMSGNRFFGLRGTRRSGWVESKRKRSFDME